MKLPGTRLLALARLVVDPPTVARVLEPLVADWQREWLSASSRMHRAAIPIRGVATFVVSAVRCLPITNVPAVLRYHAWLTLVLFVFVGTLVPLLPYLIRSERRLDVMLLLLPSSLVMSLPFAMLPLAIRIGTSANPAARSYVTRFTIAMMVLILVLSGWSMPHANQAFRERITYRAAEQSGKIAWHRTPPRGVRELTTPELIATGLSNQWRTLSPPQVDEQAQTFRQALISPESARFELHRRLTFPTAVVLLGIMGWCLGRVGRTAGMARLVFWWLFICATYVVMGGLTRTLTRWWHAPLELTIWLPLLLWSGAIVALMRSTRDAAGGSEDPPLPMHVR